MGHLLLDRLSLISAVYERLGYLGGSIGSLLRRVALRARRQGNESNGKAVTPSICSASFPRSSQRDDMIIGRRLNACLRMRIPSPSRRDGMNLAHRVPTAREYLPIKPCRHRGACLLSCHPPRDGQGARPASRQCTILSAGQVRRLPGPTPRKGRFFCTLQQHANLFRNSRWHDPPPERNFRFLIFNFRFPRPGASPKRPLQTNVATGTRRGLAMLLRCSFMRSSSCNVSPVR